MSMFAAYPAPFVHDRPGGKKVQQLIWGDFVTVTGPAADGWVPVRARNATGVMREADLQEERLLEINFVDVGQGDGCLLVTPDDQFLLVDAGEGDNLWWFLRWRFNLRADPDRVIRISHAVITHPDQDHYGGFRPLFASEQLRFDHVWHNGIVERATKPRLGPQEGTGKRALLTGVVDTHDELAALLDDDAVVGRARYPNLLRDALGSGRVGPITMASTETGHLPGFGPADPVSLQVLGPVPQRDGGGRLRLRRLGTEGETKNGHSVVLRLRYGGVTALLGGDLNSHAERHLLDHHTAGAGEPGSADAAAAAAAVFGVDVAKSCHHGSADFLDEFLAAVAPVAWVVSSGDDEPYSHPRPDTLGALGRHGRGSRPLIFSTELARSALEFVERPEVLRTARAPEIDAALAATTSGAPSAEEEPGRAAARLERAIAVYGMVTVRTDGTNALISTKLERPGPGAQEWDYYCLEPDADGRLRHVRR